jgi:hypothetical protein
MPECTELERTLLDVVMCNGTWDGADVHGIEGRILSEKLNPDLRENLICAIVGERLASAAVRDAWEAITAIPGYTGKRLSVIQRESNEAAERRIKPPST